MCVERVAMREDRNTPTELNNGYAKEQPAGQGTEQLHIRMSTRIYNSLVEDQRALTMGPTLKMNDQRELDSLTKSGLGRT